MLLKHTFPPKIDQEEDTRSEKTGAVPAGFLTIHVTADGLGFTRAGQWAHRWHLAGRARRTVLHTL